MGQEDAMKKQRYAPLYYGLLPLLRDGKLKPTDLVVFGFLDDLPRNGNGTVYVKLDWFEERTGINKRTLMRSLDRLAKAKVIEGRERHGRHGNDWKLTFADGKNDDTLAPLDRKDANMSSCGDAKKDDNMPPLEGGKDDTLSPATIALPEKDESPENTDPAAVGVGADVSSARPPAQKPKKPKKPAKKKAKAKGKKTGRRRDPHAERFKELYDSKNEVPYSWTTGDFVQKKKWQENYPGVSPEDFARFAARCWDSGDRFIKSLALTIRSLYVNWSKLHALLEGQRSTAPLFTAQQEEYMDQFAESCNAQ